MITCVYFLIVSNVPFFFFKNTPPRNSVRYCYKWWNHKSHDVKKFGHNVILIETAYLLFSLRLTPSKVIFTFLIVPSLCFEGRCPRSLGGSYKAIWPPGFFGIKQKRLQTKNDLALNRYR